MRNLVLLLFACMAIPAWGQKESVNLDTKTKQVINPLVKFGTGNTLDATGATLIGFGSTSTLTFIDSILLNGSTVSLVNDSATPGNSVYYGTDSSGINNSFQHFDSFKW